MKSSPVQLQQLMFKQVNVELDPTHLPAQVSNSLSSAFTFNGVNIQTEVGIGEAEPDPTRGRLFSLELRVLVDNQPLPQATDQRFAPYTIEVAVEGVVLIPKGAEQYGAPEDLAAVNGASLLWSAVREQVLSITSRMRAGPAMLPTVHFHDLKQNTAQLAMPTETREARPEVRPVTKKAVRSKPAPAA